nr:hypothetical protein [Tanacetum cinerariifolium]
MVVILEKSEHNVDFHPIVDVVEASPLRYALTVKPTVYVSHIRHFWSTARIKTTKEGTKILATVDGILRTITESSLRRNLKLQYEEGISSLPDTKLFENLTLIGYNISPNQKFTFQNGRIVPLFDTMLIPHGEGSGTPTEPYHTPSLEAHLTSHTTLSSLTHPPVTTALIPTVTPSETTPLRQYTKRARIAQSSALPPVADESESPLRDVSEVPRVTSPAANEDSMQLKLDELTEDREGLAVERSEDDAPIKGKNFNEGEAVDERVSNDTKEMATVLTSMDGATVLVSGAAEVPTGSGSIPTAGSPATEVPTGSDVVPTTSVARDAEVARIHVEEELQMMINSLDISNETKQLEDFIPMGSKEEAERLKTKDLSLEQESVKKLKTSEEVPEEAKSPDDVPKEKGRIVGNKMHNAFPLSVMEFPLPGEVPTASEESSHYQKKKEATAVKIARLLKSRRNCQSKSDDSYTKLVPHVMPYPVLRNIGASSLGEDCWE